jgi:hypothetical protein
VSDRFWPAIASHLGFVWVCLRETDSHLLSIAAGTELGDLCVRRAGLSDVRYAG